MRERVCMCRERGMEGGRERKSKRRRTRERERERERARARVRACDAARMGEARGEGNKRGWESGERPTGRRRGLNPKP